MTPKLLVLAFGFLASLSTVATAAPYVVYSGVGGGTSFNATGPAAGATYLYLIVDAADTSNYAMMQVNAATRVGYIDGYPLTNPTTEQANTNFFGGISSTNGKGGVAVFTSSSETTDANSNTFIARAYGTGPLYMKALTLVAPRPRPLIVPVRTNGVFGTPFTFSTPTAAITLPAGSIPGEISGVIFDYGIAVDGSITQATTSGAFLLKENSLLTADANIGGGFIFGKNSGALLPVTVSSDNTVTSALVAWLFTFGEDYGFTLPNNTPTGDVSSGAITLSSTGVGDATLSFGTVYNGVSGSTNFSTNGGTLVLTGIITPTAAGTLTVNSGSGTSSGTTTGGGTISTGTGTGSLTLSGGTTVNGGTISTGTGSLTLSGTTTVGGNFFSNGTLTISNGSVTIVSVANGLVDGTITTASLNPISFTGAILLVNSANVGHTATPGSILTGTVALTGGTATANATTLAGSTISVTTTP
jgi:hypothetical protein